MRRFLVALLSAPLILSCVSCGKGPEVLQGKVVSYDASAKTLVVRDERDPGREVALSTERAEMGERPQASDEVRVAYREAEGRLVATRVMNLTRQKELGAKAK